MTRGHFRAATLTLLAMAVLAGCSGKPAPLAHDAYVWQRRWQTPVTDALRDAADVVQGWRILAAEVDGEGRFRRFPVDLATVARTDRPAIAVVRIEADLASLDQDHLIANIAALQADWLSSGAAVTGVEIDHDAGTRKLDEYGRFLEALRPALNAGQSLSVTLLPDWLESPAFSRVTLSADETVLQLHSVHPSGPLFDPASARAWTTAMGRRTIKPFRVALPDYGSRIIVSETGAIEAIESEGPAGATDRPGKELFAEPVAVADFLRYLEKHAPPALAGIVWFRLPVSGDRRAWTPATWRAVIGGGDLSFRLRSEVQGARPNQELLVSNDGPVDGTLPASVLVEAPCKGVAGKNGYVLERQGADSVFLRSQKALFRAGSRLNIGTVSCPDTAARSYIHD